MIMIRKLIFVLLAIVMPSLLKSTSTECNASPQPYGWRSCDVSYIMSHKEELLNTSASFLYDMMRERNMEIRFVATHGTSPFTDPEGKSYLRQVVLFSKDISTAKNGDVFYRLVVSVYGDDEDWLVEETQVWRSIDKTKNWIDELLRLTGTIFVKDIQIEEETWEFD